MNFAFPFETAWADGSTQGPGWNVLCIVLKMMMRIISIWKLLTQFILVFILIVMIITGFVQQIPTHSAGSGSLDSVPHPLPSPCVTLLELARLQWTPTQLGQYSQTTSRDSTLQWKGMKHLHSMRSSTFQSSRNSHDGHMAWYGVTSNHCAVIVTANQSTTEKRQNLQIILKE